MKKVLVAVGLLVSGAVLADGFYVGGQLGLDMTKLERKFHQPNSYDDFHDKSNKSSFDGGVYLGYNMKLTDKFKIAVEADIFLGTQRYNNTNMKFKSIYHPGYPPMYWTYGIKGETSYVYNLSVLGAYAIDDMFDIYGRLGFSQTSIKLDRLYDVSQPDFNTISRDKKHNLMGMVVGFGVEMKLATIHKNLENVSVRADYRHIFYQKKTQKLSGWQGTLENGLNKHMVMVGLHYQF